MQEVHLIKNLEEKALAFKIREIVFVEEQAVPSEIEYDEFEDESRHFLAYQDGEAAGTARWRSTAKGIKLERFAVLPDFRKQGLGQALVQTVLADIHKNRPKEHTRLYLHAQLSAISLYTRFGFRAVGERFMEADIEHQTMEKELSDSGFIPTDN